MPVAAPRTVEKVLESYPPGIRRKLLGLRKLMLETAAATPGVGPIDETLKWGEPAFLTSASKSGSTVRIGWKAATPGQYFMYFICTTNLVDNFRTWFPDDFKFEGNRALVFDENAVVPTDALAVCIAAALTYQRDNRARASTVKRL